MSARRLLPVVLPVAALALLTGCSEAAVTAADVEEQARTQFAEQFPVEGVECPDDLPAEEGATITCVLESEGTSFEMTATVTGIEGDEASFDLELTEELG